MKEERIKLHLQSTHEIKANLGRNEDVLALDHALGDLFANRLAYFLLVRVQVGRVDVAVSGVDGCFDRGDRLTFAGLFFFVVGKSN